MWDIINEWSLWEDSNTTLLGKINSLFDYLEEHKILPYIVFYQTWEAKRIDSSSSVSKSYEESYDLNEQSFEDGVIPGNIFLNSSNKRKSKKDLEENKNIEEVKEIEREQPREVINIPTIVHNETLDLMQIQINYGKKLLIW